MSRNKGRSKGNPVVVRISANIADENPRQVPSTKAFSDEISYSLSAAFVNDVDTRVLRELIYHNSSGGNRRAKGQQLQGKRARYGIIANPRDLSPGMLERLLMKGQDRSFISACLNLLNGKPSRALEELLQLKGIADAEFLGGMLALKLEQDARAANLLSLAMEKPEDLGELFHKHKIAVMFDLVVTPTATAHVGPTLNGVLLALVEAKQRLRHNNDALYVLRRLQERLPRDIVVLASLVEFMLQNAADSQAVLAEIVALTEWVENDTYIHAGVLLMRAQALRRLGELELAKEVLTVALRRTVDRTSGILIELRRERFELFMEMDLAERAVDDLRKLRDLDPVMATRLEREHGVGYSE